MFKFKSPISFDIATPFKLLGLGLIIHYLCTHPPIQFNIWGIFLYWIILQSSYLLASFKIVSDDDQPELCENNGSQSEAKQNGQVTSQGDSDAEDDRPKMYTEDFVKQPWQFILVAGEDGIFLLPLLYVGINYMAAAVVGILFGLVHFPSYRRISACIGVGLGYFLIVLFVLPMGILTVVVAHIVYHLINFACVQYKVAKGHTKFSHKITFGSSKQKKKSKNM